MVLTEEQRQRIEENRKRALEIKRKKQLEKEKEQNNIFDAGGFIVGNSSHEEITESSSQNKKRRVDNNEGLEDGIAGGWDKKGCSNKKEDETTKSNGNNNSNSTKQNESDNNDDDTESLEEFELNSSPYISQTEAQRQYCIPKGTLDVCSYVEKDNPHKKGWSKMKLYHRSEIRKRAYKRFGGKEGLILEREKRRKKRCEKDMNDVKNVFG